MGGLVRTISTADGSSVPKKWQLARPTPAPKPGCPGSKVDSITLWMEARRGLRNRNKVEEDDPEDVQNRWNRVRGKEPSMPRMELAG